MTETGSLLDKADLYTKFGDKADEIWEVASQNFANNSYGE